MKKTITIPRAVYELALAVEKNCFIQGFVTLLKGGLTVKEASRAIKARSFEYPLITAKGAQTLNYQNYRKWAALANARENSHDCSSMLNRIRRLSNGKARI